MSKMLINQRVLDSFTEVLDDIVFSIKVELSMGCDHSKIRDLLDELKDTWTDAYSPIDIQVARSQRVLYGRYLMAKKAGDKETADLLFDCYLAARKK